MADEQKPVNVLSPPEETVAAPIAAPIADPIAETKPAEETPAEAAAPATEDKPAEEAKAAEDATEKNEVKPVEEGYLGYKAHSLSFPKNLITSKEFFFFGTDAVDVKSLSEYRKHEKSADIAQSNMAWASHTGKGLLFYGSRSSPLGIINLSDANEPDVDSYNKFHLITKNNKHSFKAANTAERDNWVSQLKLKIAEAKEIAESVIESEVYKNTFDSFKVATTSKKEDKPAEAAKEETAASEEPAKTEDPEKESETANKEPKSEEAKRRSVSRKRASIFAFGKKEEAKAKEAPAATPAAVEASAPLAVDNTGAEAETSKIEEPVAANPVIESKPAEETTAPTEPPKPVKRNSLFGGLRAKKDKKSTDSKAEESAESPRADAVIPAESTNVEEAAPVIPPVETTTPLTAEVASPANVPVETKDITPINSETKKDAKEKRKSSLPFGLTKREKSSGNVNEEENKTGQSAFSKFRATIKGRSASKAEDKPTEDAKKEPKSETEETPAADETAKTVEPEVDNQPENVATSTPAVTAAA